MSDNSVPIELQIISAANPGAPSSLKTFSSYSFEVNIMVPGSPFRFTAEGVNKATRIEIRSSDTVGLFLKNDAGTSEQIATGFIDETDTNIMPKGISYVLTGRDTVGQLIDNAAVDSNNKIIHIASTSLLSLAEILRSGTRIPGPVVPQQTPNGNFLFQTNPGETKINALQRYLEFANCLVWSLPNGQIIVGKPNMSQNVAGNLLLLSSSPSRNNILEARVRRNTNTAIKKIAVQLQSLDVTDPTPWTFTNVDEDVQTAGFGRSVFELFSQGKGTDAVNQINFVGSTPVPQQQGATLARRRIARENVKVLDIEAVLKGHVNDNGDPYKIDQMYSTIIEDEEVEEDLYVYAAKYEMTKDRGRVTTLRLCRKGTIVADVSAR